MPKYPLVIALSLGFLFPQLSQGTEPPPGTGNDNPNGVTGEYNGSITTGGSYDPYTGNAKRFVTDLAVTGSLGAYPLKWSRVLNTRGVAGVGFGHGGTWKHSYNWGLSVRNYRYYHHFPEQYEGPDGALTYPDGRSKQLNVEPDGSFYWYNENVEPDDQLVALPQGHFDLILADGGRVEFRHDYNGTPGPTLYSLTARRIIDPHGLVTVLERDPVTKRLQKIIEPGGRYLEITYHTFSDWVDWPVPGYQETVVILQVKAFARPNSQPTETVGYSYLRVPVPVGQGRHYHLTQVNYADGHPATYTYHPATAPPEFPTSFVPGRIRSCNDPRFAGAMKKIEYVYAEYSGINGPVAIGQIKGEKYPGTSTFVSEVEYPVGVPYSEQFLRTEKRPDGRTRTFQYSNNGDAELEQYTDFKGQSSSIDFPMVGGTEGGYVKISTDALHRTTSVEKDNVTGAVLKITYHDQKYVLFDYHDPNDPGAGAHHLFSKTDERGNVTSYTRFPENHLSKHRISIIHYSDGGYEKFIYNPFGQIVEHRLTSGAWESFRYDERGLKTLSWPPSTPSDETPEIRPTQYFYYQSGPHTDRLQRVVDPRGNATSYEYNGRGQVTKVTHQDGTFTQSHYNGDGTLAWTADENHPGAANDPSQRTRYEYDEYKRVTKVTNPLNHFVRNSYNPDPNSSLDLSLTHTTSSIYRTTSHLGKMVDHDYDENFRRLWTKQASGTGDEATTQFTYDPVGNLETTTDPRLHVTRFGYDDRNRQISVKNEALDETTEFRYDDAGNKIGEIRPDGVFRTWDYDNMNRLWHAYDWRTNETPTPNQTTTYVRDHAGNATSIIDTKGARYDFVYDDLNRKESATYPDDAHGQKRTETWLYDHAGNLLKYKNPDNKFRHFHHDERNRQDRSWWDGNAGPEIMTDYDAAGRVEWIETRENGTMVTRVTFGYDAANRKIWEGQTLAGHPTRWVKADLDEDGRRRNLQILETEPAGPQGNMPVMEPDLAQPEAAQPGGYFIAYDYTERNQVKNISGESWAFNYSYDAGGNLTSREAIQNGRQISSTLCPTGSYDARNRPATWEQIGRDGRFGLSNYRYDRAGREELIWREEENNRGERFVFEPGNQLKKASYNIQIDPPSPTPPPTPPPGQSPTPTPPPGSPPPVPPPGQVTLEEIELEGEFGETLDVTMRTETAGATIFYKLGTTQFLDPTHDGPTPTNNTSVYGGTLHVGVGQHLYFRAVAYKAGMIDSTIVELEVDNTGNPQAPGGGARIVRYTYTPDMLNRSSLHDTASGLTNYEPSPLNQYSSVGGMGYSYDHNFNLTAGQGFSGTYDAANRLVTASNSGLAASAEVELVYDGLGRCVKRTNNGVATVLVYDDWKPIAEWDEWGYIEAWNVYGPGADEILLRHRVKVGYIRFHADANGNVAFLVDNDGRVIEKYSYDAFGKPKVTDGEGGNARTTSHYHHRFLFQGREYIDEAGVYDYRNRFYHPGLGRFLQKDPTGFDAGDMNLFRYCGDDPIDGSDPTGLANAQSQITPDRIWEMAKYMDSGNSLQGTFSEQMGRRFPAGMDGGRRGDMAGVAEKNEGSTRYRNTKNWRGKDVFHCNEFVADMAEASGRVRPQVWIQGFPGGFWRDPVSNELADPNVKIPRWSEPKPLSEARRNDIVAQQHGKWGHTGIVTGPRNSISVNTDHGGVVEKGNWGFRPFPDNGEKKGDPPPVVRHYIAGGGSEW